MVVRHFDHTGLCQLQNWMTMMMTMMMKNVRMVKMMLSYTHHTLQQLYCQVLLHQIPEELVPYTDLPANDMQIWSSRLHILRTVLASCSCATALFSTAITSISSPRTPTYGHHMSRKWLATAHPKPQTDPRKTFPWLIFLLRRHLQRWIPF